MPLTNSNSTYRLEQSVNCSIGGRILLTVIFLIVHSKLFALGYWAARDDRYLCTDPCAVCRNNRISLPDFLVYIRDARVLVSVEFHPDRPTLSSRPSPRPSDRLSVPNIDVLYMLSTRKSSSVDTPGTSTSSIVNEKSLSSSSTATRPNRISPPITFGSAPRLPSKSCRIGSANLGHQQRYTKCRLHLKTPGLYACYSGLRYSSRSAQGRSCCEGSSCLTSPRRLVGTHSSNPEMLCKAKAKDFL
jgi:hypothetical protein